MKTILLLLSVLVPVARAAEPLPIGAAAAVSGSVSAMAPGAASRGVASGARMFHKDAVSTDAKGRLQVMLLDETIFTMGPGSRIVLDEFVYDPFTSAGKVTAEVTKGVFRFVSGKTARRSPEGLKVKLPVGTLGIRGTIAGGKVEGDSALIALLGPGQDNNADERPGAVSVENAGTTVELDRPGTATRIAGPGEPPSPPFMLTPELLAELSAAPPGDSGSEAGTSGGSSTEESGQDTAAGRQGAGESIALGEDEEAFTATSILASQSLGSGVFTWEDLRNALASGSATYFGQDNYTCTGGGCGGGSSGQFSFHFNINWGTRQLGGGGSSSHIAFTESGSSGYLNQSPGAAPGLIEAQIPTIDFQTLAGQAKLTFGSDFTSANSNNAFNGSAFEFKDGGKNVAVTMVYNGNNQTSGGAGLIAHAANTSTSGTATAACSGNCPP